MDETTWRAHPQYVGYEVAVDGRIRSVDRYVRHYRGGQQLVRGRELKFNIKSNGYYGSTICVDGRRIHVWAHSMVCETYRGPRPSEDHVVRHLNGDPLDNRVENVVWGTWAENAQDRLRHGHHEQANKTHCKYGHEFTEENTRLYITKDGWRQRLCRICSREQQRAARRRPA